MFQHDNAQPHVASICTPFLEAENVPVFSCSIYSDMSPIEHVWNALYRCVRQHVPVPANIQQLSTASKKLIGQHSTGHNQQPDQLYAKEMCQAA